MGITSIQMAQSTRQSKHIRRSRRIIRELKRQLAFGNVNCHHMVLLLEAGLCRLSKKSSQTIKSAYDNVVKACKRGGFIHHAALSSELAGKYYLEEEKDFDWAAHYLSNARDLYLQWGALAIVERLEKEHSELLPSDSRIFRMPSGLVGNIRGRQRHYLKWMEKYEGRSLVEMDISAGHE